MLRDRRKWLHQFPATILLVAVGYCAAAQAPVERAPNTPAADFTLKTLSGENLRLFEYLGQVVLINFWASWAGPSRQEMVALERLHSTYRSAGLVLLGINLDDDQRRAMEFVRAVKVSYPVMLDVRKTVAPLYGVKAVPTTFFIDRAGAVRYVHSGFKPGVERDYVAQLRALLDE